MSETSLNRRGFLASLAAFGGAALVTRTWAQSDPAARPLKLGFDNFSVRDLNWKAPQLIRYAASLNADVLLLSDLDVYESLEADYLKTIRAQAEEAGVELQVGTGSICPTSQSYHRDKWGGAIDHARLLIRTAQLLGSPVARCYLGSRRDRVGEGGIYRHIDAMSEVLRSVQGQAEEADVKIAVENHAGDMQAWELVGLIEAAGKEFVGATMDPGNAVWTLEDPMVNLEVLGPYALTTGIRDSMVWEIDQGASAMWTNMGTGQTDWESYVRRFRELCPTDSFVLEIISYKWRREMTYLEPAFWDVFPYAKASEFARFVALAKRGHQAEPPVNRPTDSEKAKQKFDLEQSLAYCRNTLGIGQKS